MIEPVVFEPVKLPPIPRHQPAYKRRRSALMGFAAVFEPDGSLAYQEDEWQFNGLHDAGEQYMLQRFFSAQALATFYLALLNDASIAETDGTMAAVTESKTPASGGYDRKLVTTWSNDGLISGDYRFSGSEVTFGAITTANLTATAWALTDQLTSTAGLIYATLALQATTTVAIGQFFKLVARISES